MKIAFVPKFLLHDHLSDGLDAFSGVAWECEYIITVTGHSFTSQSLENMIEIINGIYSEIISNAAFLSYFMLFHWKLE